MDIAYDIHVRRVFLRTGLAQWDDLDHMLVAIARVSANSGLADRCPPAPRTRNLRACGQFRRPRQGRIA